MAILNVALNAGSAVAAFIAAIFWFISAAGKLPTPDLGWGASDKLKLETIAALDYSAKWNRLAAVFSGLSVLLLAGATALPLISKL